MASTGTGVTKEPLAICTLNRQSNVWFDYTDNLSVFVIIPHILRVQQGHDPYYRYIHAQFLKGTHIIDMAVHCYDFQ